MRNTAFAFVLLAAATLTSLTGCHKQAPEVFLFGFYDNYLTLSCPEHDYPDYYQIQDCQRQYLTQHAYNELERRHDVERNDWLDYDIFIQGQDCWPGICAERVVRVEHTRWYDVTVALPDYNNRDSVADRKHVFSTLDNAAAAGG